MDSAGNLYGTTQNGGLTSGTGTIFELVNSTSSPGTYSERIIYAFLGGLTDGAYPSSTLVADAAGNLYGTTLEYGTHGYGIAFELVKVSGGYVYNILYNFGGSSTDAANPDGRLLLDSAGNVYGATTSGGTDGLGAVFRLSFAAATSGPTIAFSPTSLQFGSVVVGTSSTAQALTVTNSGPGNLTFGPGAVTISGTNIADFAIASDACSGQTITPNSTCAVSVSFKPSVSDSENATLNFSDNAIGSPQTVVLAGMGGDFSIAAASGSSTSATVTPGQTARYTLMIASEGAFNQAVGLTCTGAPSEATCSVSPNSLTLNGSASTVATVTVTTTAASRTLPPIEPRLPCGENWPIAIGLLALLWFVLWMRRIGPRSNPALGGLKVGVTERWRQPILAAVLLGAAALAACGGGGGSSGPPPNLGTPTGTYTLTVTGTSGSLTHSTSLTLTVN